MDIPLDEVIYVEAIASSSTGAAADADSTPTFAVYEEATDTDIGVGGNMTKRTSLTGDYRASFTASAANGFELGKWYAVIGSATISGVAAKGVLKTFRIVAAEATAGYPKTDVNAIAADAITASAIADNAIDAGAIASNAITAAKIADGAIDAATFAAGAIDAAAIAADAIDASALAADAVAEIQSGLSTLNAAGIRSAVGLASANLDTQLSGIPADVLAETVDGITVAKALEVTLAALAGVAVPSGSTVAFKKRDGTTTTITITYGSTAGERTASAIA